jgi:predicted DCC family thiol-disulfide oxidoreductase YuxK
MSRIKVYYNSACPVCDAGIGAEKRRMQACSVDAEWIDIHRDPEALEEIGARQEFVRERLHVVDDSGTLQIGAAAIGALWSTTPQRRRFAALLRLPVMRTLASWLYNGFAAVLYRWNRMRGRW